MPPPLAFQTKVKYPDIYNRFRKLRGPIRTAGTMSSKRSSKKRKLSPSADQTATYMHDSGTAEIGYDSIDGIPAGLDFSALSAPHHAELAQHMSEALLRMPSGVNGDAGDDEAHQLDQQVLKIARLAAEQGEQHGEAIEETVEDHGDADMDGRDEIASVDWNAFAV